MLTRSRITTIMPVVDLDRAREFYEKRLGLAPIGRKADGAFEVHANGGVIALSPRSEPSRNPYTALSFEVSDVVAEVKELTRNGVVFEDYDLPGLRTVDKVCVLGSERAAWFKDPDGNILCIHQNV
jgi:catechol 2,3-dioxygenase-like lactoylglutathione lyase family enzyme